MAGNHPGKQAGLKWNIGFVLCLIFLLSCVSCQNYTESYGPVYRGSYATTLNNFHGDLKVISWNLRFAENIDAAIESLEHVEELRDADVLLLQEMDEDGVDRIAQQLAYNYVYYPATVHPHHGKNYGNAILTKFPITDYEKIMLPNSISRVKQLRIAMLAQIQVEDRLLDVYNAHLEVSWMLAKEGSTQVDYLFEQIDQGADWIVLGGDFNSWSPGSISYLEKKFAGAGLARLSAGTGHTFTYQGLRLTLDHIFSRETSEFDAGVRHDMEVSDHYPVWAKINLSEY
jgi:endonuclease/exonuclease/phosphatase family metal-dependent hydrolase